MTAVPGADRNPSGRVVAYGYVYGQRHEIQRETCYRDPGRGIVRTVMPTAVPRTSGLQRGMLAALVAAGLLGLLTGCGAADTPVAQALNPTKKKAQEKPKQATAADASTANMTSAVNLSKSTGPVEVKFEVLTKPQPGQPLDIDLALIPNDAILRLMMKVDADRGLELVKGSDPLAVERPGVGVPIRRTLTVVPKADGIYVLTATVTTTVEGDSKTLSYAVPLIAGGGVPELPTKTSTASTTGIKSR